MLQVASRTGPILAVITLATTTSVGHDWRAQDLRETREVRLQGAGATFPNPIYQKWFSEYNKLNPGVFFDYQSIGSGGGVKQITENTIDFGGSDAPVADEVLEKAHGHLLHIPTVLGAVVIAYNLPGITSELRLTPDAIAGIFLGKIKVWNDPEIASANSGINLPPDDIIVVNRADGCSATQVLTDYLSKVSVRWKERVGTGTSVKWLVGVGAKGNEGVAAQMKQMPNSISYLDLLWASYNDVSYASIRNSANEFVLPSSHSITAAAASSEIPDDLRVSITDAPGSNAYPISSFTYLLVYQDQSDKEKEKGERLVDLLWWAIHDGQKAAPELHYAPLPQGVVEKAEQQINSISYHGEALHHDK
jgi:phosphate transport system substrate-binding protein